ncbi:hypothetical protein SLA2020_293680 [Shorea laevis]
MDHYSREEFNDASHVSRRTIQSNFSEDDDGEEDADMALGKVQKIQIVDETSSSVEHINELGGGSGESGSSNELCMVKETVEAGAENFQCNHEELVGVGPVYEAHEGEQFNVDIVEQIMGQDVV